MGTVYGGMYDPKRVEIIVGNVSSVENITPMRGMSRGIHLIVQTDKETISVHLGPAEFIEKQDIKFKPTDKVEVKGSRITFNNQPAILAAEVKKGDKILKLRDGNGVPVWSGWRRR
jgi:hypothetical protein